VKRFVLWLLLFGSLASGLVFAQRYRGRGFGGEGLHEDAPVRTARDVPTHSTDFPEWTNAPGFEKDVFTFVRVQYRRHYDYATRRPGNCFTDFPDSDLDLSFRLQQLTSMNVDPDCRVLRLTDPDLTDFPFLYMVEPGRLRFEEAEVKALQKHLSNGGFLMADDFWGPLEWENFEREMKRVFPERQFVELEMDHPLFSCVFDLRGLRKNDLQVPNFWTGELSQETGITWECEECRDVHIRGLFDEKGRMMAIACHNTDNGDGWEREQEFEYFFRQFSEKRAYPLAINILFYVMTH
jgi:hypothetical protein